MFERLIIDAVYNCIHASLGAGGFGLDRRTEMLNAKRCAEILLEEGIDASAVCKNRNCNAVNWFACAAPQTEEEVEGAIELTHRFIKDGAAVDLYDEKLDSTPLHSACRLGFVSMIGLFVGAGADMAKKNKDGKTPRDVFLQCTPASWSGYCGSLKKRKMVARPKNGRLAGQM